MEFLILTNLLVNGFHFSSFNTSYRKFILGWRWILLCKLILEITGSEVSKVFLNKSSKLFFFLGIVIKMFRIEFMNLNELYPLKNWLLLFFKYKKFYLATILASRNQGAVSEVILILIFKLFLVKRYQFFYFSYFGIIES